MLLCSTNATCNYFQCPFAIPRSGGNDNKSNVFFLGSYIIGQKTAATHCSFKIKFFVSVEMLKLSSQAALVIFILLHQTPSGLSLSLLDPLIDPECLECLCEDAANTHYKLISQAPGNYSCSCSCTETEVKDDHLLRRIKEMTFQKGNIVI